MKVTTAEAVTRTQHLQRGILLEYLTIGWNIIEGIVAVASGAMSGSIALVGFGIDSFIETSSGAVLLWRLRAEGHGQDAEKVERKAVKLVGVSFLLLATQVHVTPRQVCGSRREYSVWQPCTDLGSFGEFRQSR